MAVNLDTIAFRTVYERNWSQVHAAANSVLHDAAEAEDVAQEVFLRLWNEPDRFDPKRGTIDRYLRMLARSRALDRWRSLQAASRARDRLDHAGEGRPAPLEAPDAAAERRAEHKTLVDALHGVPPAQREAIALTFFGDMTAAEVARRTAVPLGTAKSRVRLGIARLEQLCRGADARAA